MIGQYSKVLARNTCSVARCRCSVGILKNGARGTGHWPRLIAMVFVVTVCAATVLAQEKPPDPFAGKRAEAQASHDSHRAKLFVELAHAEMEAADKAFTEGYVDLGQKLAADSAADADQASKTAVDSGKRLKDTELDLAKLERRTRDIGKSLNFDDRPPIEKIVQRIQQMRQALLDRMFKKKGD